MRQKRTKTGQKKLLKKSISLIVFTGITLTLGFGIKTTFFDKKETAQANADTTNTIDSVDIIDTEHNIGHENVENNDIEHIEDTDTDIDIDKGKNKDTNNGTDITEKSNNTDSNNAENENTNNNENSTTNENNKNENKTSLDTSVFLGDSITEALSFYEFVDYSRVVSDKGYTAKKAISDVDTVVNLNPDRIFIMFGLNDFLTERSVDSFINNYTSLIHQLKEGLPNADIYIQSILPVGSEVENTTLPISNSVIEECNKRLKELAQQENMHYLDIASIVREHGESLREPDGIHYKSKFCTLWLEYISENI